VLVLLLLLAISLFEVGKGISRPTMAKEGEGHNKCRRRLGKRCLIIARISPNSAADAAAENDETGHPKDKQKLSQSVSIRQQQQ
jgi:hypothetical protein